MFENVQKISIIGGPGTGKTTLSNNIGKELNYPIYHIDGIHHLENWVKRDSEERDRIILEKVNEPKWVIDGTYRSTLEQRVKNSDLIIFLDYSSFDRLKGILSRYFKNRGIEKPEIPGCKEQMNLTFMKFTLEWNRTKGKFVKDVLKNNKDKEIIVFKNRRNLNKWYQTQFGKKIEF